MNGGGGASPATGGGGWRFSSPVAGAATSNDRQVRIGNTYVPLGANGGTTAAPAPAPAPAGFTFGSSGGNTSAPAPAPAPASGGGGLFGTPAPAPAQANGGGGLFGTHAPAPATSGATAAREPFRFGSATVVPVNAAPVPFAPTFGRPSPGGWTCNECNAQNTAGDHVCAACDTQRP